MILDLKKIKGDTKVALKLIKGMKEKIKELETIMVNKTGRKLSVDNEKIEQIFQLIEQGEDEVDDLDEVSTETAIRYAGTDT